VLASDHHSNILAIIFDMDGLMIDSEPLAQRAWVDVLDGFGVQLDDTVYNQMIGLRLEETARLLQQTYELPVEPRILGQAKEKRLGEIKSEEGIEMMPGLEKLVDEIEARCLPWAVATSSLRANAVQNLRLIDLLDRCNVIVGGDEVSRGKPAPDIYLLAAQRLSVDPHRCLALEDSIPGVRSAQSAGMVTVAIPGSHSSQEKYGLANHVFPTLNVVVNRLDDLLIPGD
jgi:HAD superfamily hydrolase (TIGR01509 family)